MTIGEKIRKYRKEKGLTQKQLSELSGYNISTIQQYEYGKIKPSLESILKLANVMNVSAFEIGDVDYFDMNIDVKRLSTESKIFIEISSVYGINNRDVLESLDAFFHMNHDDQERISSIFNEFIQLNQEGQEKVSIYISDIKDKYRKKGNE